MKLNDGDILITLAMSPESSTHSDSTCGEEEGESGSRILRMVGL